LKHGNLVKRAIFPYKAISAEQLVIALLTKVKLNMALAAVYAAVKLEPAGRLLELVVEPIAGSLPATVAGVFFNVGSAQHI
jgi:hypothetical protein